MTPSGDQPNPRPERRIRDLLEFVLDGSCSDEQRAEFSQLLDDQPQLISRVVADVFAHNLLMWHGEEGGQPFDHQVEFEGVDVATNGAPEAEGAAASGSRRLPTTVARVSSRVALRWALGISAALLIAAVSLVARNYSSWKPISVDSRAVAEVVHADRVEWAENCTALTSPTSITAGRLETKAGELTLKFRSGPVVQLKGATSLMIESDMLVHLDHGQATARVPRENAGFTIKTPVVDVIDQGTEFGVATRSNGFTDVVVFDGEVDLRDSITADLPLTRLVQGEGARVDRQGELQRLMQVGINAEGAWWTSDDADPLNHRRIIKEVRDNIPPEDGSKYFCYQITYGSLKDDVFAYSDHRHQWNGTTRAGLASFLVGADYVKTFNDYRYMNDFEMEVLFERPANLYVLFDDRVPPPSWLTAQFTDTGTDVGLDEGPWPAGDRAFCPDLPLYKNGVGSGVSIDNVFSVWHRRCPEGRPVVLGAMGPADGARAMYGIVATPLESARMARLQLNQSQPKRRSSNCELALVRHSRHDAKGLFVASFYPHSRRESAIQGLFSF